MRTRRKFIPSVVSLEGRALLAVVAVVDSGVAGDAFAPGVVLPGFNVTGQYYTGAHGDSGPSPGAHGLHGTEVARIILEHAPPGTQILPIQVDADGDGVVNMQDVARGISVAWRNGASVINVSLGSTEFDGVLVASLAVADFNGHALVVAAAGDYGVDLRQMAVYPAASNYLQNVVSVGAADASGNLLPTSDRGLIDYAVPAPDSSFAAATVSGVAAWFSGTPIAVRQALHRVFPVPADSTSAAYASKPVAFFGTPHNDFRRPLVRPASHFARFRRLPFRPPATPVLHAMAFRPPATPVPPGGGRP